MKVTLPLTIPLQAHRPQPALPPLVPMTRPVRRGNFWPGENFIGSPGRCELTAGLTRLASLGAVPPQSH